MKVESYCICSPVKGMCKQKAIWAYEGNKVYPIVYLQRPKWIKDDSVWDYICDSIRLEMLKEVEIK